MRVVRSILAAVALATLTGAITYAADRQSQIQNVYQHRCKAAIGGDAGAFAGTFSPTYVAVDLDRNVLTLDEVAGAIAYPAQGMVIGDCAVVIRGISIDENIATVAETQRSAGTVVQDGIAKPFVDVVDSLDIWRVSGSPKELSSKATGERLTVDGVAVLDRGILASPSP
jgi:hypothetical protein